MPGSVTQRAAGDILVHATTLRTLAPSPTECSAVSSADPQQPDHPAPASSAPPRQTPADQPQHDLRDTFSPAASAGGTPQPSELSPRDRFRQAVTSQAAHGDDNEEEQTLWEGNYSPRAMLGTATLLGVISVAVIVLGILYQMPPLKIGLAILVVLWLVLGVVYAVRRLGIHYELTTQRFIHQTGLISRRTDRIEVIDIDDVAFFQGPVERILGIGTIDIASSDRSHPHILMPGIPEVRKVASMIDDVRRRERKRRSLHIQTM